MCIVQAKEDGLIKTTAGWRAATAVVCTSTTVIRDTSKTSTNWNVRYHMGVSESVSE